MIGIRSSATNIVGWWCAGILLAPSLELDIFLPFYDYYIENMETNIKELNSINSLNIITCYINNYVYFYENDSYDYDNNYYGGDDNLNNILLPYEFKKIALMPNLKEIANEYFTNEEEVKKNGNAIEFLKPNEDSDLKNMLFSNS